MQGQRVTATEESPKARTWGKPSLSARRATWTDWKEIMRRLKRYMKEQGVTTKEMGKVLSINPQRLRNWLNGRYVPRFDEVIEVCNALGANPCQFIPGSEEYAAQQINLQELMETFAQEAVKKILAERTIHAKISPTDLE